MKPDVQPPSNDDDDDYGVWWMEGRGHGGGLSRGVELGREGFEGSTVRFRFIVQ